MVGFNEATTELLDTWLFSVSLFVAITFYDIRLALMSMAPVPFAFILAYLSGNWIRSRTLTMRRASSNLTGALQEYLTGMRVLGLFGRTGNASDRIDNLSEELLQSNLHEARFRLGLQPVYATLVTAGILLVVWIGGRRVIEGLLSTGGLVAFIHLYTRFVGRGHRIPLFFKPNFINGTNQASPLPSQKRTWPIGSGKSALLKLLVGLYTPSSGSISLGRRPLREWDPADRASCTAYLPQNPGLFSGTIKDNIGFETMDPETQADIIRRSGLERDISEFPQGMDTAIGEGGIRISGGQGQRIALARALSTGCGGFPGIILLDDPFPPLMWTPSGE